MDPIASLIAAVTAVTAGISSMPVPAPLLPPTQQGIIAPRILGQLPPDAQRIANPWRIRSILVGDNVTLTGGASLRVTPELGVSGSDSCNSFTGRMFVSDQGRIDVDAVRTGSPCSPERVDNQFWLVVGKPMVLFVDPANRMYLTTGTDTLPLVKH